MPFREHTLFAALYFDPQASIFLVSHNSFPVRQVKFLFSWLQSHKKFLLSLSSCLTILVGMGNRDIMYEGIPSSTLLIKVNLPPKEIFCFFQGARFLRIFLSLCHTLASLYLEPNGMPRYVEGNASTSQPKIAASFWTTCSALTKNTVLSPIHM